jgi:hypothetical protein
MPSNDFIVKEFLVMPWHKNYQEGIKEGQMVFHGRTVPTEKMHKIVNHYQLNDIFKISHVAARRRLERGDLPDGISLTADQFDAIPDSTLFDYFGKEDQLPTDAINVLQALRLIKIKEFRYLSLAGILDHWKFIGVVNNLSIGTSPSLKVNPREVKSIVANVVVAKRVFVSNIWGGRNMVVEGGKIGFVIRRRLTVNDTFGAFELVPWTDPILTTPPMSVRSYVDNAGYDCRGFYQHVGTVSDVGGEEPDESKRRLAIGAGAEFTLGKVHDALGGLPQIQIQVGV